MQQHGVVISILESPQPDYDWMITSCFLKQIDLQSRTGIILLSLLSDPSSFPANTYTTKLINEVRNYVHVNCIQLLALITYEHFCIWRLSYIRVVWANG